MEHIERQEAQLVIVKVKLLLLSFNGLEIQALISSQKNKKKELANFILKSQEDLEALINSKIKQLINVNVTFSTQLKTFGPENKNSYPPIITISYLLICKSVNISKENKKMMAWIDVNALENFSDKEILNEGLEYLKVEAKQAPIAFHFLSKKFTLPKLRRLYSSLLEIELDKRNFRNKMIKNKYVIKLSEKEKKVSRKGAHLYVFNHEMVGKTIFFKM